jgi:hypothetical protein
MKWTEEQLDRRRRLCTKHHGDGIDWNSRMILTRRDPAARFALVDNAAPPQAATARSRAGGLQRKQQNAWSTTSVKLGL